jgi:hypothetical protein
MTNEKNRNNFIKKPLKSFFDNKPFTPHNHGALPWEVFN